MSASARMILESLAVRRWCVDAMVTFGQFVSVWTPVRAPVCALVSALVAMVFAMVPVHADGGPAPSKERASIKVTAQRALQLIQPGRPMQNGYIESFNGKFRDECLNGHWFQMLARARSEIAIWRKDYNEVRPNSSLGQIPPAEFAQRHRSRNQPPPSSGNEIK